MAESRVVFSLNILQLVVRQVASIADAVEAIIGTVFMLVSWQGWFF